MAHKTKTPIIKNCPLTYNEWMKYLHETVNKDNSQIGRRSITEIYKEIQELQEIDKIISDKVRASYSIKR